MSSKAQREMAKACRIQQCYRGLYSKQDRTLVAVKVSISSGNITKENQYQKKFGIKVKKK